ncbi:MAG: hypothetical protein R3228_14380 [Halioglobus sp.]|nr:hypothetical protein [Halioglobus sp.]
MTNSSVDMEELIQERHTTLHTQDVCGRMLTVKETAEHRWFEYGGQSVQSIMNKAKPEQLVTPVSQALLIFLLFDGQPRKILNLGLGGASLERALANVPGCVVTSVEKYQPVIDIARRFFKLPQQAHVVCQSAEQFVQTADAKYEAVLCDLFFDEKLPGFLATEEFFFQLYKITSDKAVVMLNTQVETEEELLSILIAVRKHFPYIALIEFERYKNVVMICSSHKIPSRALLRKGIANYTQVAFSCLERAIAAVHYIPHGKS